MNKNKIKKYWNKSKHWKKGLIIALTIFIILNIFYLIYSLISFKNIVCPTFGGGIDCGLVGYLLMSLIYFFWYFILIGLPIIIISSIIGWFIGKNEK